MTTSITLVKNYKKPFVANPQQEYVNAIMKNHTYQTKLTWTGNLGSGTESYRKYSRDHSIIVGDKPEILSSSDPSFRGDPNRYNPEELFLASLSSCHMLWFLHLASVQKIIVTAYEDHAEGTMVEEADGSGRFTKVVLKPLVTIEGKAPTAEIEAIHHEANKKCFIANSCNFPIIHKATLQLA